MSRGCLSICVGKTGWISSGFRTNEACSENRGIPAHSKTAEGKRAIATSQRILIRSKFGEGRKRTDPVSKSCRSASCSGVKAF